MAKKAVNAQERLEALVAGVDANPNGPQLNVSLLKDHVATLNDLEYKLGQAKLALKAASKARDAGLKVALDDVVKAEYAVKAHYGPKSPKVKEYIQPRSHPKTKKAAK